MYVLFGLLLVFFSSVHGKMIQCFVGGVVKYDTSDDSITNMQEQYCDMLVKADDMNVWEQILHIKIDTKNVDKPIILEADGTLKFYTEIVTNSDLKPIPKNAEEFHETYSNKNDEKVELRGLGYFGMITLIISLFVVKLLHMNKGIIEYWDDIVKMGTDMHRLKFHSKLLNLYYNSYKFSQEEMLVFLKSSYSVIGIYSLTNNLLIASSVAEDTYSVLLTFNNALKNMSSSYISTIEFVMWGILSYSALLDMPEFKKKTRDRSRIISRCKNLYKKLNTLNSNGNNYPCSYLFLFRSILLDRKQLSNVDQWVNYGTLVNDNRIRDCDNHADEYKIQMYKHILLSIYNSEFELNKRLSSFNHLLEALKIPVFTSEDRLINYKVTTMAMNKISVCVNQNYEWLECENDCFCNTLKSYQENDKDYDNILTKLTYMQVYQMINNDSAFIPDYCDKNGKIDENKLHMIVTMGLDIMDNNYDLSSKRIKIIKKTIKRLNQHVKTLEAPQTVENIMTLETTKINEYYIELMRAYKWLTELYGVLCTDSNDQSNIKKNQESLETSLAMAIMLQIKHDINDVHLQFLFYKKICKDSQLSYSWERHYKADGWVQITNNSDGSPYRSMFLQGHNCFIVNNFLGIDNRFIHQADVNILIFKHLMKEQNYDDSISTFVKNALTHLVVTSEDRVRNLQAHDLYSMYFVWRNYKIVKEIENN